MADNKSSTGGNVQLTRKQRERLHERRNLERLAQRLYELVKRELRIEQERRQSER